MSYVSRPIGIGIVDGAVSLVALRDEQDGSVRLLGASVQPLGNDHSASALAEAMRHGLDELGVDERRCALSLSDHDAVLDRWERDPMDASLLRKRQRIEKTAYFQARKRFRQRFADSESEILVDQDSRDRSLMWLSAVRSDTLSSRLRAARLAGLRPVAVAHDALSYARVLPTFDAVVEFRDALVAATLIVYSGDVPEVQDVRPGERPGTDIEAIRRFAEDTADRIRDVRQKGLRIERVAVVGPHVQAVMFARELGVALPQLHTACADLADRPADLPRDVVARYSPEVTLAYGNALFGEGGWPAINLLRADRTQAAATLWETPHLRNGAAFVAAALIVWLFASRSVHTELAYETSPLPQLRATVQAQLAAQQDVSSLVTRAYALNAIESDVADIRRSATARAAMTSALANALARPIAVSSIKRSQGNWTLVGHAPNEQTVGAMMTALRAVPGVVDVSFSDVAGHGDAKGDEFTVVVTEGLSQ